MSKALEESSLGDTTPTSSASHLELKRREKTIPHYLRASTGSCHDLCKYGHKNPSEEVSRFSGGSRKKLPTHLNNLALHKSAILDRSKDVRNRILSLAKSSISLGEAERVVPKLRSANHKGAASNEHMVLQTTSAEHTILNSDGNKKRSMVAEKPPTNLRNSNGVPKCDRKEALPGKTAIYSAKLKVSEKTLPEKSRTVHKVTTVKHSLLKGTASSSTDLNMIKKVPDTSQISSQHPLSSKDKITPKGKITSPSAAVTRVHAKHGRSLPRPSNAHAQGKEGSDVSMPSFSMEPKLTASVEVQEDSHVKGYSVESIPAQPSSDATEYEGNSRLATKESSKSISDDDMLGNTEKSEALACEASMEGETAIELQQSLYDKEFNIVLHESLEYKLAKQNVMDDRALKNEDGQIDDASLCQLPVELITVENADVHDPLSTQNNSKIEDDCIEVNVCVEPLHADNKAEVGVHENLQRSLKTLATDEKQAEKPESCLDFASENAAENDKADDVLDSRADICASYCNSISETSSDGGLLEEPNSMLIEPSDSTVQIAATISVSSENSESEGLESRTIIPQLPEELSDDEFYEEYDFEFSESDEGMEDGEASVNIIRDESVKTNDQRLRRAAALQLDDASATPYKLKFKRGKIVELPPDSSGPRRLKFRRKAANEVLNSKNQTARRIYKRNNTNNVVPAGPDVESSGVKLRHQDAQEKKDAQVLFNNVIEETASKLVESRKSKVKALVGAFETVISLQDSNPTSQAGNSQDSVQDGEENAPEDGQ